VIEQSPKLRVLVPERADFLKQHVVLFCSVEPW
jgi:hypothetical protein